MVDLSQVPAEAREALREQIKADKQAAVEKRLAKIKIDEETQSKLDELEQYKAKDAEAKKIADDLAKETTASEVATKAGLKDLDLFKELKAYDKFTALETEEEQLEYLKKLEASKPQLFKKTNSQSVLDMSNVSYNTGKKDTIKVY